MIYTCSGHWGDLGLETDHVKTTGECGLIPSGQEALQESLGFLPRDMQFCTHPQARSAGWTARSPPGGGGQWCDRHTCGGAASDISGLSWGQRLRGSAARMEPGRMEKGLENRRPLPGTVGVTACVSAWKPV